MDAYLRQRERAAGRLRGNATHLSRDSVRWVYPNRTEYDVQVPDVHPKCFTPDGDALVCFSGNLDGVHLYTLRNPSPDLDGEQSNSAPYAVFSRFFRLRAQTRVVGKFATEFLNKNFCTFVGNGRYILLASHTVLHPAEITTAILPTNPGMLRDVLPSSHVVFYTVEVTTGRVCGSHIFRFDQIQLNHHQGVSVYGNRLAVVSLLYQAIHVLEVTPTGRLVLDRSVGWFLYPDDAMMITEHERWVQEYARRRVYCQSQCYKRKRIVTDQEVSESRVTKRVRLAIPQDRTNRPQPESIQTMSESPGSSPREQESLSPIRSPHSTHSPQSNLASPSVSPEVTGGNSPPFSLDNVTTPFPIPPTLTRSQSAGEPTQDSTVMFELPLSTARFIAAAHARADAVWPFPEPPGVLRERVMWQATSFNPLFVRPTISGPTIDKRDPFPGLRQRLLTFLFRRAQASPTGVSPDFYRQFTLYESLVFNRVQFLSPTRLLIRMTVSHAVLRKQPSDKLVGSFATTWSASVSSHSHSSGSSSSSTSSTNAFHLFVEYDLETTEVLGVYDHSSETLWSVLRSDFDTLCQLPLYDASFPFHSHQLGGTPHAAQFTPTIANSLYLQSQLNSVQSQHSPGTPSSTLLMRKCLLMLPSSPQCLSTNPLLDPKYFITHDRWYHALEKFQILDRSTVEFKDSTTGQVRFTLQDIPLPSLPHRGTARDGLSWENPRRSLGMYIVHPTLPFIISMHAFVPNTMTCNFHYFNPHLPSP
ncbi:acid phosphatase det1 [Dispira simplex]|nr:acid phosphatase det1 [Dispira simplex]